MSRLTELIKHYQRSVDYLAENWDVTTRHMEMGEIRQHREHCQIEDDTLTYLIELQKYKDLEEQGRLIELPCKVGDTVWIITEDQYRSYCYAYPVVVDWIKQTQYVTSFGRWDSGMVKEITFHIDDFGKTVFLTKEEAEKALAELNNRDAINTEVNYSDAMNVYRELNTHDREKSVSELAELKGTEE